MPNKMAARSIKKHDLQEFLEKEVAPRFGSDWVVGPHCTLQRRSGYFIQGFSLFRLSFGPYRVYLFNKMLALTKYEDLNITHDVVRERKTRLSTGSWLGRFFMPRELWIEWYKRIDELNRMVALIYSQMEPPYDQEITLELMLNLIGREPQKNENFQKTWARSVIRGLLGDMRFAQHAMEQLANTFGEAADKYKAMGEESYQSRIETEVKRKNIATEMLKAMTSEKAFHDYIGVLTSEAAIKAGFSPNYGLEPNT